jgi:hypothetical protein
MRAGAIRRVLEPVVRRIYDGTQRAVQIIQGMGLPPWPALEELERREAEAFADFMRSRDAGYRLTLRDSPKAAAFRLAAREDAHQNLEAAIILGDEVGRARARLEGKVLVGTATNLQRVRLAPRLFDFLFELESDQRVLSVRRNDTFHWSADPRMCVTVVDVHRTGRTTRISLRIVEGKRLFPLLSAGMVLELVHTVPNWQRLWLDRRNLRDRLAVTPWTHAANGIPASNGRPDAPADPLAAVEALR